MQFLHNGEVVADDGQGPTNIGPGETLRISYKFHATGDITDVLFEVLNRDGWKAADKKPRVKTQAYLDSIGKKKRRRPMYKVTSYAVAPSDALLHVSYDDPDTPIYFVPSEPDYVAPDKTTETTTFTKVG